MSSNGEPSLMDDPSRDIVTIDQIAEAEDWDEASGAARIWAWVVPIALVHLAPIYALARWAFDFKLPSGLHGDRILVWLWANGAAIGLGVWFWKKGRIPIAPSKWLLGWRARRLTLMWLGASIAWFVLPAVVKDAWDLLSASLSDW